MRSKRLLVLLALPLLCSPSAAQNPGTTGTATGDWHLVGPKEPMQDAEGGDVGRINSFAFDPTHPQTIYAATPAGGLWRTQDDGAHWLLLSNLPEYGIQDIAVDPKTSDTMYVLTGDGDGSMGAASIFGLSPASVGVLKSVDGGRTWSPPRGGTMFKSTDHVYGYRLAIDPAQPSILIAATTRGLWRTTDGGQSWSQVTAGILAMDRSSPLFFDVLLHPTNPSIVYAASTTQVYRSNDAGQTWTALSNGLPSYNTLIDPRNYANRIRLAVTPAKPDTLYVLYGAATGFTIGLYRSDDQGRTFTKRSSTSPMSSDANAPPPIDLTKPNIFGYQDNDFNSQSWYTDSMAVSPVNADIVHAGGVDTWVSKDGGVTWSRTSRWNLAQGTAQYVHADIHMLAYHNGALYAATDGGIYRSKDDGNSWTGITRMETGITIAQIYHVCSSPQQPDVLYYGAQDNGTYRLGINGEIRRVFGGDGFVCRVDTRNPNTLYISYADGDIHRTDDAAHATESNYIDITPKVGGVPVSGPWLTPYILAPSNPSEIYACYADVWYSSNRGFDWTNLTTGVLGPSRECRQIAISPADPKTIYVAKEGALDRSHRPGNGDPRTPLLGGGGVFRSTDGGHTWQSISGNLPLANVAITDIAVSPTDTRRAWVTFQGFNAQYKVFSTTDGGATWVNISSGLPNISAHAIVAAKSNFNAVYLAMDDGVYYRDDRTGGWRPFKDGLPNTTAGLPLLVTSLLIDDVKHRLFASTFSRGVWVSDLHTP